MVSGNSGGTRPIVFYGVIHPWHHDQFGHMNVRWYAHFFDDAAFFCFLEFGLDPGEMQEKHSVHTVTANTNTAFIKELMAGDLVKIDGAIKRLGNKSITVQLRMLNARTGETHATYEIVEVFFDPVTRKSASMPDAVRNAVSRFVVTE